MDQHLLSIILLTPLAGLAVLLFIPGTSKDLIRVWANLVGFAGFLISLPLVSRFQLNRPGFQFEERAEWIPDFASLTKAVPERQRNLPNVRYLLHR